MLLETFKTVGIPVIAYCGLPASLTVSGLWIASFQSVHSLQKTNNSTILQQVRNTKQY